MNTDTPKLKPDCMGNCPTTGSKCESSGCGSSCIKAMNTDTPTPTLSKKEKPEAINARLFDLCRYQRSELFEADLITYDEYMYLMHDCHLAQGSGSPSPRRLENYDEIAEKLAAVTEQLEEARDTIAMLTNTLRNNNDAGKAEYDELKEQRDRMAEAIRKYTSENYSVAILINALQSLNQPNE